MVESVLLVRAGRTGPIKAASSRDREDRALDARGRIEARTLAEVLARYTPTRVVTSPLVRAVQTGAAVAAANNSILAVDTRLAVDANCAAEYVAPREGSDLLLPEGRGDGTDSLGRGRRIVEEQLAAAEPGGALVMVTHRSVLRWLMAELVSSLQEGQVGQPGSWNCLVRERDAWRVEPGALAEIGSRRARQAIE